MSFPALKIGDLTAKIPVVQGGMGVGISLAGLASAVANQGGIGVIAGAMIGMKEPDVAKDPLTANLRALRNEILKARELSNGIIGVNLMVALTTFSQMVRTAVENKVDIIFSGAGLPLDMSLSSARRRRLPELDWVRSRVVVSVKCTSPESRI